jgi:dUTP pyrophosphatase
MSITKIKVRVKRLTDDAKIPTLGTEHAAGFDIYSSEDYIFQPGERHACSTGIAIQITEGKVCLFWDRSGMGFKGMHRFAGVIDSDYRGELKVILYNSTKEPFEIKKGDRIVQAIIQDYYAPEFEEVENLDESIRGENRFGSTGK